MNHIGLRIKELRKKKDLTQEKLAEYLNVSFQAVSKWETGASSPDLSMIVPLARLLGVSTDALFGLADTAEDPRQGELSVVPRCVDAQLHLAGHVPHPAKPL